MWDGSEGGMVQDGCAARRRIGTRRDAGLVSGEWRRDKRVNA